MRILYAVHQFFPYYYTGTERFVLNLARQMQRLGHQVRVVTYGITDEADWIKHSPRILYRNYIFEGIPVLSVRHSTIPDDLSFSLDDKQLSADIDGLIQGDFDVVHFAHPMRLSGILDFARKRDVPTVLTLTDFWLLCPRAQLIKGNFQLCEGPGGASRCAEEACYGNDMRQRLIKRYFMALDFWQNINVKISPSRFLSHIFEVNGWAKQGGIIWNKHGIDYNTVKPLPNKAKKQGDIINFGFIGTLLYTKGVHVAIEAWQKVRSPEAHLYIYGPCFHETEYFEHLKELADSDPRIHFMGAYNHEKLASIMTELDVVLVPSIWWENSPLTLLTSLAYGMPVIASDIGGMAEFVDSGKNGWLFPVGNAEALAELVDGITSQPKLIAKKSSQISKPPRIEEEAFYYEMLYSRLR